MNNKTQLQENNSTLERVLEQLRNMPTTEDCMALIAQLQESALSMFTATVSVDYNNWVLMTDGLYIQTVPCGGLLPTDVPIIDVQLSDDDLDGNELSIDAWSHIINAETSDNAIVIYADRIPDVSFQMKIKVVR